MGLIPTSDYCYAKQYLAENHPDCKISIGGKQILVWDGKPNYEMAPLNTAIILGEQLAEGTELQEIRSYKQLTDWGFVIIADKPDSPWFPGQRMHYKIARYEPGMNDIGMLPIKRADHWIEYDQSNKRLRLMGRNAGPLGRGPWTDMENRVKPRQITARLRYRIQDYQQYADQILSRRMDRWKAKVDIGPQMIDIKEVPVMFSVSNELVCIPKERDMPRIGCVGKVGSGKTFEMNGILGRVKYKWKDEILLLNDSVNQTFNWALPNQSIGFSRTLDRINEFPMPYPLVFLFPTFKGLESIRFQKEGIGFRTSLPFTGVVENYNYFFQGKKEWLLGESQKYFRQLKENIAKCKTIEQIEREVEDNLKDKKGLQSSINKIVATMEDLWDYNFLDVSSGIQSKWCFEKDGVVEEQFPWIGLMELGIMPAINTSILKLKHFYPQYLRFIIDTVYSHQIEMGRRNKQKRVWLAVDEIGNIYKRGNRKTPAAEALVTAVTEGRNHQIGTIYTIQNYSMLDPEIRSNTNYLFSLVYSSADEINAIARDFDLTENDKESLKTLAPHEMLAISNDKPFVVYHPDGERYERTGVFRGFGLPPLSQHSFPGGKMGTPQEG